MKRAKKTLKNSFNKSARNFSEKSHFLNSVTLKDILVSESTTSRKKSSCISDKADFQCLLNSASAEETIQHGFQIGKSLSPSSVITLTGDLGAGKTTLIKGIAQGFAGISAREISSPTFTYLNIYSKSQPIYHFDLYRLHSFDDFLSMGFDEYLEEEGLCLIEWPELILDILPEKTVHIEIKYTSEMSRELILREKTTG